MKYWRYLLIAVLLPGCQQEDGANPLPPTPNIVIVMTDDQGWGDLGVHGNSNLQTPHLDALAANGASFTNFYVQPVCSPTRAEMLTGRYARRLGVHSTSEGGERFNLGEQTIAELFKEAGYATAAYGKWHSGSQPPYHPNARGFDNFYGFTSGHWGSYFSPMLEHNGAIVKGDGYLPDDLTQKAMEFIEDHSGNPFLVFLSLNTPHSPMQVPDSYWDRFKEKQLVNLYRDSTMEEVPFTRAALAMVENIDDNVGRLRGLLERLDLQKKTILVFLSDNGPNSYRWNAGMRGRKGSTDEGGVRVPFFVEWEGVISPLKKIPQVSGAIDLMPTLASMAGLQGNPQGDLDGRDLSPLLLGDGKIDWPDRYLYQHWNNKTSVRSQSYRLDSENRLYDIPQDRGQLNDVVMENPVLADSMVKARQNWLKDTYVPTLDNDNRPLPLGHPGFNFTHLPARDGHSTGLIKRSNQYPNCSYFTNWTRVQDSISWEIQVLEQGLYSFELYYTCAPQNLGAVVELRWGNQSISKEITEAHDPPLQGMEDDRYPRMESYIKEFKPLDLGNLYLEKGRGRLQLNGIEKVGQELVEVRLLTVNRVQ